MSDDPEDKTPGFKEVAQSVAAAAFGVQSSKNRERDFSKGKPSHYIALGLLFTLIFILVLYGVVQLVVHLAGI